MKRELPSEPLLLLRHAAEASPPDGAQARVAGRLAASVVAGVGASASTALAAPKSSGGTVKVLAERFVRWSLVPLGVGVALGAGGQALRGRGELHPRAVVTSVPVAKVVVSAPAPVVEPLPEPASEAVAVLPAPSAVAKNMLAAERNVLDRAGRQLASDEPAKALGFLEQHAEQFPRGQLSEEREAMWINVLALLGRGAEAKTRGEAFTARFPNSLMGSSVRAALLRVDGAKQDGNR